MYIHFSVKQGDCEKKKKSTRLLIRRKEQWLYWYNSHRLLPSITSLISWNGLLFITITRTIPSLLRPITLVTNHEAPTLDIPSFRSWWNVRWLGSTSHQASMKWMSKVFGWICHTFRDAYSSKHSFNWASLYPCSSQTFEHRPIFVSDQAIEMWHWYQYVYVETVPFWRLS